MANALSQYLDLYLNNRAVIDSGSSAPINSRRDEAYESLKNARFPDRSDEGFEKTSIEDMFAPDFGLNINRLNIPVDIAATFRCDVPNVSTLMGVVANDKFLPTTTLIKNKPEGVTVMSLAEAGRTTPELVERYYGSVAPMSDTGVAFNSMLLQDGIFIHIAEGVRLEKPIQIVNIFSSLTPMMAVRRMLIVAEANSSANILLCDHSRNDGVAYLASQVTEIIAKPGSTIEITDIEESSESTGRYCQTFADQQAGSSLKISVATLLNGTTRNEYSIRLNGPRCSAGLYGMAIGSRNQHIDNSSTIIHAAERSASNQLFRYVLDEKASGAFEGGIEVTPDAPFTEAYQSNNNILASPDARMHSKPQLLIFNDDVKCSHGATTGQLNNEALFYMQTRGIPRQEARTMLMQAFMVDVIDAVGIEGVRDRLRHLVEKRFAGTLGSCPTCENCRT